MGGRALPPDGSDLTKVELKKDGQLFDAEEMLAIREQYEERVGVAEARREELEWHLRRALAQVRDAELEARRAADMMNRLYASLEGLIKVDPAAPQIAPAAPRAQVPRPAMTPPARQPLPPPAKLPPARMPPPPPPPAPSKASAPKNGPLPPRPLNGYKRLVA